MLNLTRLVLGIAHESQFQGLGMIQSHMAQCRFRLDKLHKTYFERDELEGIGLNDNEINNLEGETWCRRIAHWRRGWEVLLALMLVLWVGAYLVAHAL